MAIANCKRCDRIFNQVRRDICPACIAEEDKAFDLVRTYLRKHRDADMTELTEATEVPMELIVAMIQDGRLILRDNPNMGYPCERCGNPTQIGRFCSPCAKELTATFETASAELRQKIDHRGKGYHSR